jgi:hypothetical protein
MSAVRAASPIVCVLCILCTASAAAAQFKQNWLYKNTLNNANTTYDLTAFPVNITVEAGIEIKYIHEINTKRGLVDATIVLRTWWTDSRLTYPESAVNEDNSLLVKKKDIWWPEDVEIINGRGIEVSKGTDVFARVYPDGRCYVSRKMDVKFSCPMDATNFPFDEQRCDLRVEAWFHSDSWVHLNGRRGKPLFNPNTCQSEEFALYDEGFYNGPREFSSGLYYTSTTFVLRLKRYPSFYIETLIVPCIMLLLIQLGGLFVSAAAAPARVCINLTVLLTLGALRIPIANLVPVTASSTWIGSFQSWMFTLSTWMALEFMIVNYIGSFKDQPAASLRKKLNPFRRMYNMCKDLCESPTPEENSKEVARTEGGAPERDARGNVRNMTIDLSKPPPPPPEELPQQTGIPWNVSNPREESQSAPGDDAHGKPAMTCTEFASVLEHGARWFFFLLITVTTSFNLGAVGTRNQF